MSVTMKRFVLACTLVVFGLMTTIHAYAEEPITVFKGEKIVDNKPYYLRLTNGNILTGEIVEIFIDEKDGEAVKIKTVIGTATVYAKQIAAFRLVEESYRQTHRVFLMPTA